MEAFISRCWAVLGIWVLAPYVQVMDAIGLLPEERPNWSRLWQQIGVTVSEDVWDVLLNAFVQTPAGWSNFSGLVGAWEEAGETLATGAGELAVIIWPDYDPDTATDIQSIIGDARNNLDGAGGSVDALRAHVAATAGTGTWPAYSGADPLTDPLTVVLDYLATVPSS